MSNAQVAQVVLGANYGDEGKGAITDYLVARECAKVVVRFNGGAQAGHTVQTPDGKRHTFHHFSSGTFLGARTFLSRHFVLNPMLYVKERAQLASFYCRRLIVDPRAYVTTPWDIIVNQARERAAGDNRLGSCGVGHRDTVDRNEFSEFGFTIVAAQENLTYDEGCLISKLEFIRGEWLPERLDEYRVPYTRELQKLVFSDAIIENYLKDIKLFSLGISLMDTCDLTSLGSIVFEGSQGLGLDQKNGTIPHVTRSNTGIKNVLDICNEAGIKDLEVYYATRAYLTRHGQGPMENELKQKPYKGINEMTNVNNEFQGSFRYGNLDVDALRKRIKVDLRSASLSDIKISPKLAVTCIDHLDPIGRYIVNGKLKRADKGYFSEAIAKEVGLPFVLDSQGPTRDTVRERIALCRDKLAENPCLLFQ